MAWGVLKGEGRVQEGLGVIWVLATFGGVTSLNPELKAFIGKEKALISSVEIFPSNKRRCVPVPETRVMTRTRDVEA